MTRAYVELNCLTASDLNPDIAETVSRSFIQMMSGRQPSVHATADGLYIGVEVEGTGNDELLQAAIAHIEDWIRECDMWGRIVPDPDTVSIAELSSF